MLFINTLPELGLKVEDLEPSALPFHGIIPGRNAYPLGQVTLHVTFGSRENYRTERITFQVADLNSAYHAILSRPAIAKFLAIPHYPYLMLKMPGPNGVLTFRSDIKTTYACNIQACELAAQANAECDREEVRLAAASVEATETAPPSEETPTNMAGKERLKADQVASNPLPLDLTDPSKMTHIGSELEEK